MKLGRRPLRQSPYSVNWLTTSTRRPLRSRRVHLAFGIGEDAQTGHLVRQPLGPSRRIICATPSSTSRPRSITPTTSSPTVTRARQTRCTPHAYRLYAGPGLAMTRPIDPDCGGASQPDGRLRSIHHRSGRHLSCKISRRISRRSSSATTITRTRYSSSAWRSWSASYTWPRARKRSGLDSRRRGHAQARHPASPRRSPPGPGQAGADRGSGEGAGKQGVRGDCRAAETAGRPG